MTLPTSPDFYPLTRDDGSIVYHLGSVGALPANMDPARPVNLGPYDDVPGHWWNARWTDRTACPLTIRRSPAKLVAANRMFPYGDTGCTIKAPPARVPYTKMGSSSVTKSMPTTGERPDIGLITDNSARFMLGQDPLPMLDWAQAAESIPNHFRDEATGKPIDLFKYYNATTNPAQHGPLLLKGPGGAWGGGWKPQQAHYPELSYVAHIATLDAGFLEGLQYSTTFKFVTDAWLSSIQKKAILYGEYRGVAWAFASLFMCHIATKDAEARGALPASCHPSSYWKALLDQQLVYYSTTHMNNPANQLFRLVIGGNRFSPWMADYMLTALAFGVLTGHSDWAPFYLWALKNAIERTKGGSYLQERFPAGWGTPYRLNVYEWAKNPDGTWNRDKHDLTKPLNWWSSFEFTQHEVDSTPPTQEQIDKLKIDPLNGGVAMSGFGYNMTTRAVLVQALYLHKLGLVDVKAVYPELDTCFANCDRMVRAKGDMSPRHSVVLDASGVPDTLPPPPPPPPPDPPEALPISVHGLKLRAQEILALVKS